MTMISLCIVIVILFQSIAMLRNKLYVYGDDREEVPAHINYGKYILDVMMKHKHITALINSDTGEQLTYGELAQQTVSVALTLTRMGVRKGDVIAICSEKRFEVMACILGIICAGATYTGINITYGEFTIGHRVQLAKPRIMFCSPTAYDDHKKTFDSVGSIENYVIYSEDLKDDAVPYSQFLNNATRVEDFLPIPVEGCRDRIFIIFSSGTTGLPKGVPVTHLNFLFNSKSMWNKTFVSKPILSTREWYYSYGLLHTLSCMHGGATIVYSSRNGEAEFLETIQKYKIKIVQFSTTTVTELIKSPLVDKYDVTSVEHIISSGSPISAEQVDAVKLRFTNLKDVLLIYGMSEAGNVCSTMVAPKGCKAGSVGIPSPGFTVKIVNIETRQPVGPNERGEICFQSPSLMLGYMGINNMDHLDEEGFYKTGDVGYYDEDQYFFIVNRVKELIKFKDSSVAPAELESILLQHAAVREAGVVGTPHELYGEVPVAFVVLQPGAQVTEEALVAHIDSRASVNVRLAAGVRFVETLPRGAGGKLDRNALKLML